MSFDSGSVVIGLRSERLNHAVMAERSYENPSLMSTGDAMTSCRMVTAVSSR